MSRLAAGLSGLLLSAFLAGAAHSASLQAAPVLVEMKPGALSSVITVRNTGSTPIDVQTRVMRWRQSAGVRASRKRVRSSPRRPC